MAKVMKFSKYVVWENISQNLFMTDVAASTAVVNCICMKKWINENYFGHHNCLARVVLIDNS